MKKPFLYVANWKMQKNFEQVKEFVTDFGPGLAALAAKPGIELAIAPSFVALHYCFAELDPAIAIAAQDCSAYSAGAYTSQVDALSLHQVGCSYAIVGHGEARRAACQTDQQIADKVGQLLAVGIIPIVCIGESQEEYRAQQTTAVLARQLAPLESVLTAQKKPIDLCLAYEPLWSIGTGLVAHKAYLTEVFEYLASWAQGLKLDGIRILYGGSVDQANAAHLRSINQCGGFLIGTASLDFQKFQNIVSLF